MQPRIEHDKAASDGVKAVSGLETVLLALVNYAIPRSRIVPTASTRTTKEVRACGETEQLLYALTAWRGTPFFSHRE